jgi:hypothetical protein
VAIHPQRGISQIQENPSIFWLPYGTLSKYGEFSQSKDKKFKKNPFYGSHLEKKLGCQVAKIGPQKNH